MSGWVTSPRLGLLLLLSVALREPLLLVAENPGGIVSFTGAALFVVSVFAVGWCLARLLVKVGLSDLRASVIAALSCGVFVNWSLFASVVVLGIIAVAVIAILVIRVEEVFLARLVAVAVVVVGVGPAVDAAWTRFTIGSSHVDAAIELPTGDLTGNVEDIVVVLLDGFSGLTALNEIYEYDSEFVEPLESQGMTIPSFALSSATTTFLSFSEMLEGVALTAESDRVTAADRRMLYDVIGGNNRFVGSLRAAGFTYTHVEGGWEGSLCGSAVDICVEAPWYDNTSFLLWYHTPLGPLMEAEFGHPHINAALKQSRELVSTMDDIAVNGRPDLLIAHILLPHPPFVLDGSCEYVAGGQIGSAVPDRYLDQVQCAATIAQKVVERVPPQSALLITADHGVTSGLDGVIPGFDPELTPIIERLNVFMAYRMPSACRLPSKNFTLTVVESLLSCAAKTTSRTIEPEFTYLTSAEVRDEVEIRRLPEPVVSSLWEATTSGSEP